MEDIAAAVGVSGPALYRHFPSKYSLFAQCAKSLGVDLLDGWAPAPLGVDLTDPTAALDHLDEVFAALARITLTNRRAGGIYRWEGRYLETEDREQVRAQFAEMIDRVAALVRTVRPEASPAEVDLLGSGALSVVASLTAHRTTLATGRAVRLITRAAHRVVLAPLPGGPGSGSADSRPESGVPAAVASPGDGETSRRAAMPDSAIQLFASVGFAEVTIEAIAAEAGLTPSGFYRHFSSKADVLLAACLVASERLNESVETRHPRPGPRARPRAAGARLCGALVLPQGPDGGLLRQRRQPPRRRPGHPARAPARARRAVGDPAAGRRS